MLNRDFWIKLEQLIASGKIVIERPKGSPHPRYPDRIYPFDYGYLLDTLSSDAMELDVWVGSSGERIVSGILCTIDLEKRDIEIKVLVGCTRDDTAVIEKFHNTSRQSSIYVSKEYIGED
jgi:inorganic pyrophosphatase